MNWHWTECCAVAVTCHSWKSLARSIRWICANNGANDRSRDHIARWLGPRDATDPHWSLASLWEWTREWQSVRTARTVQCAQCSSQRLEVDEQRRLEWSNIGRDAIDDFVVTLAPHQWHVSMADVDLSTTHYATQIRVLFAAGTSHSILSASL